MFVSDNYMNFKRHEANMRNQLRTTSSDGRISYTIIRTNEELMDYALAGGEDLPYALRKEVKRQRYVWNSEAVRKNLDKAISEALNQMQGEIIA